MGVSDIVRRMYAVHLKFELALFGHGCHSCSFIFYKLTGATIVAFVVIAFI